MPKTKAQKTALLQSYTEHIGSAQSVVIVSTTGIKVSDIEAIRDAIYPQGLTLQVAKNSLLKLALAEHKVEGVPAEVLDQPIALLYSKEDPIAGPKTIKEFGKKIETLTVLGGITEGAFITPAQVKAYADLPSREQLLGQLVGTLQAPISGMVNVLAGNLRGLVTVLGAIKDQKAAA